MAEFDYELPEELIAQEPVAERDASRLLVIDGGGPTSQGRHRRFRDLADVLRPGDLLVVNEARVLAARVQARRLTGGRVELLFLSPTAALGIWRALARPAKRVHRGELLTVGEHQVEIVGESTGGERLVRLPDDLNADDLFAAHGVMPLPPYIRAAATNARDDLDRQRYQTVYATNPGAVAAPTAGLHFTPELLERLRAAGVEVAALTLHVGLGTFRPVTAQRAEDHEMDVERYEIPESTAAAVNDAGAEGRRVVAVGTTVVRALEHSAEGSGRVRAGAGAADLFIMPGYSFRVVDAMITNFHLPRSTPLLLVGALIGREPLLAAYREAIEGRYRFYSYGDAMLVQP